MALFPYRSFITIELVKVSFCNKTPVISLRERNYSGTFLGPPAAASEEKEKGARTPRAPAGAHHPPDGVCVPLHPLLNSYKRTIMAAWKGLPAQVGDIDRAWEGTARIARPAF